MYKKDTVKAIKETKEELYKFRNDIKEELRELKEILTVNQLNDIKEELRELKLKIKKSEHL